MTLHRRPKKGLKDRLKLETRRDNKLLVQDKFPLLKFQDGHLSLPGPVGRRIGKKHLRAQGEGIEQHLAIPLKGKVFAEGQQHNRPLLPKGFNLLHAFQENKIGIKGELAPFCAPPSTWGIIFCSQLYPSRGPFFLRCGIPLPRPWRGSRLRRPPRHAPCRSQTPTVEGDLPSLRIFGRPPGRP